MTVKCKGCGAGYDTKYKVCPACGAVRLALPLWSKITAAAAAGYLILTLVMLLAGAFDFSAAGADTDQPEAASPPASETAVPAGPAETTGESPPAKATPEPTPTAENVTLSIRSDRGGTHDTEFTWYIDDGVLQLYADIRPEPADGGAKPEWKSSDESVFKVDENGLLTPLKPGSGTLTVSYDPSEKSITVIIRPGSLAGDGQAAAKPQTQPPANTRSQVSDD